MRGLVARLLLILALFAVGGVIGGVLWEWWWTPPTGAAVNGEWFLDSDGAGNEFSGTGLFVIITAVTGLVLGILCAALVRANELWVLGGVVVGALLAGAITAAVGGWLGPPDPRPLAKGERDFTPIPSDLQVVGLSPYLAAPMGALAGVVVIYLSGRRVVSSRPGTRLRQLQS